MKTLLFNGCSFTTGGDLGWNYELGPAYVNNDLWKQHINSRKSFNLSAKCAKELSTRSIDLSLDGSCNYFIATTTMNYINSLSSEEKNNLHVCVGWAEPIRYLMYVPFNDKFQTISPDYINSGQEETWLQNSFWKKMREEFEDFMIAKLKFENNLDHALRYISEIGWLENFLKANNITYTFWRSMGVRIEDDILRLKSLFDIDKISQLENWISFDGHQCPWLGASWKNHLVETRQPLSANSHPLETSVATLTARICENIKKWN